jgi:tape measure domain-containing protein
VAVANIAIEVNGQQAANALKQITTASRQLESAVGSTTAKINNQNSVTTSAANQLKNYSRSTQVATAATNGLRGAVTNLLGAFTAISTAKFIFAKTAELETQTRSLEVLTGSVTKAKAIIQELQQLGAVTPFTSTELIDSAKRLNAFGVEGDKVVETTRRLADVAGATGAELQGLVTAYGQVQAKGRLQGEELLQFQERGIALQEELRKMYGLSGEEFQKALSKGRISAEAVELAIKRLTDTGGKYANGAIAQSETLQGKFSTLTDGVEGLARTIGTVLAPQLKRVLGLAIQVVNSINQALAAGSISDQTKQGFKTQAERTVSSQAGFLPGGPFGAGQISIKANGKTYRGDAASVTSSITNDLINKEVARRTSAATKAGSVKTTVGASAVPALLGETGGGTRGRGSNAAENAAKKAAEEAAKEAERVSQVIRDRLAEGQLLRVKSELQDKILTAEFAGDKMLAARLGGLQKEIDIQYQYAQALAQEKDVRAQEAIIFEGNTKLVASQRDIQRELAAVQRQREQEGLQSITAYLEKQYELNTAIQQQKALAESVSTTLGQGMTAVFDTLIQGSDNWGKSLQQIASKVLVDIANQLIRIYVIEQAVSAIKSFLSPALPFGGGGGQIGGVGTLGPNYGIKQFANGGVPPVGRPSLVGERGPELFMPGIRGTVIPNGGFGGGTTNVVVNVDASGSNVQGDQAQAKQLGVVVSAAVQAELVKQQRPGGLLAGTRR